MDRTPQPPSPTPAPGATPGVGTTALVVVPTYDEALTVETLLDGVLAAAPAVHVLVVDDGSPDGTAGLVAARARQDARVHLLERTAKQGLGAAYRAGFAWAAERGYPVLVEMDADLSHPPARLPALLDEVGPGGADLAIGSRYVPGGATENWPWRRRLISRGGNAYVRSMLGLGVSDATAGFRAFRADLLDRIDVASVESNGYCFQVETTFRAVRSGARVVEVPITFADRTRGTSKMSTSIAVEALWRVTGWSLRERRGLRVDRRGRRRLRPGLGVRLLGAAGAALLAAGTAEEVRSHRRRP